MSLTVTFGLLHPYLLLPLRELEEHDWIVLKTVVVVVVVVIKLCIEFEQFNHVLQTLVMVLMNSLILPGPFRIEGYGGDGE